MRIAYILGAFSIGTRPLDFNNLWSSDRGLTGTDLAFIRVTEELAKLGHDMYLFTVKKDNLQEYNGMKIYNFEDRFKIVDDTFDVIITINEPNALFGMARKPKRIVWQYLNDFSFIQPDFDKEVDQYLAVCEEHKHYVSTVSNTNSNKWAVVPLGCDPDIYFDKRVPGRVVWCSSADRGLHWLLSQWSQIKAAVPHASLKIFYHFNYGELDKIEPNSNQHPHIVEMGQRIRYMKHAISKLKELNVEHVGSISRNQMQEELSQASVFGFSCDTVAFSEGFSVSTLEAHASYTVPVITDTDCLGGIYKDSGCVMIKDIKNNLSQYRDAVIKSLTDQEFANNVILKSREFAIKHSWQETAKKIEKFLV